MKVFLIILAVLVVLTAIILSMSCEFTVIYDNGWTTKIKILFIEKDIELTKLLSFIIAPEKAASDVADKKEQEKKEKQEEKEKKKENVTKAEAETDGADTADKTDSDQDTAQKKEEKPNFIKKIYDNDGIVGILLLVSNLLQTANSAIITLFKGFHIYSLYVKIIVGGSDAADIARAYGKLCGVYYPLKGVILNGMKVDQYDDYIQADFIAPRTETEFQFIAGLNVALLLKVLLSAGKVFLVNLIKNR